MEHVLDNPAWNALISGDNHLGHGNAQVKYFDPEVSPFIGFKDNTDDDFEQLHSMMPAGQTACYVSTTKRNLPAGWKSLGIYEGMQMIFDADKQPEALSMELTPLTHAHVPQMLELVEIAKPGPFNKRTIDFGEYYGVFQDERLVAMTGQRMHIFNYTEISAVCTHPDFTGRGYARQLILKQLHLIRAAQNIPILHVRQDNTRAISVYESLGFVWRSPMNFNYMERV